MNLQHLTTIASALLAQVPVHAVNDNTAKEIADVSVRVYRALLERAEREGK